MSRRRARRKTPTAEAATVARRLAAPSGLTATRFRLGGDDWVVLSYPLAEPVFPEVLSPGERDVARGMLEGLSNEQIASRRESSVRTVANQVASIFKKLGINSRAELPARLADLSPPTDMDSLR